MKFPANLIGPQIADGDVFCCTFEDVELTLRLPVVPRNTHTLDKVIAERDFRNLDTRHWTHYGDEGFCHTDFSVQDWEIEDAISFDNIAHCLLNVSIQKHSSREVESLFSLNSETFRKQQLAWLAEDFSDEEHNDEIEWPTPENEFFCRSIKHELVDGIKVQLELVVGAGRKYPSVSARFPLGRYHTLGIEFSLISLHYPDRKNPYSESLLRQLQSDFFDDFLSHIRIEYTNPEVIELIKQLKKN